ncbi:MAG: hypothetical protein VXW43_10805 [Pseudomonadota bacterium]|nr:hypothetical protein [Pseudomonadota bacterium]
MTQSSAVFSARSAASKFLPANQTSEAFVLERLIARNPSSDWVSELETRFRDFNNLAAGWDGYGGQPIDFHCARFTEQVLEQLSRSDLPAPSLVPLSNGTLQFEWHLNDFDLEVEVHGPLEMSCYRNDLLSGEEEERLLRADLLHLRKWLNDMAARN